MSGGETESLADVGGVGRTPNISEAAKMQIQLETGHVLPVRPTGACCHTSDDIQAGIRIRSS